MQIFLRLAVSNVKHDLQTAPKVAERVRRIAKSSISSCAAWR
jgi:hypothetical protein